MGSSLPRLPVKLGLGRRGKKKKALISSPLSCLDLETESDYSIFLGWYEGESARGTLGVST